SGQNTGNTSVSNTVAGITGTATIVLSLSGASGTGTVRIDDFTLFGAVTSAGFVTAQNGAWEIGSTWVGGTAPGPGDNATVAHNVTSANSITRNAGTTTTVLS